MGREIFGWDLICGLYTPSSKTKIYRAKKQRMSRYALNTKKGKKVSKYKTKKRNPLSDFLTLKQSNINGIKM